MICFFYNNNVERTLRGAIIKLFRIIFIQWALRRNTQKGNVKESIKEVDEKVEMVETEDNQKAGKKRKIERKKETKKGIVTTK